MSKKPEQTFEIDFNVTYTGTVSQLWPDGDAPESPTIDDVREVIELCGGPERVICDWDLAPYSASDLEIRDLTAEWEAYERRAQARMARAYPNTAEAGGDEG